MSTCNWASSRENPSSGFPTKRVSNQSPQLQSLARKSKFHLYQVYIINNDTFQKANNKGADQTVRMRRLVCAFAVRKPPKTGFLTSRPNLCWLPFQVTIAGTCQPNRTIHTTLGRSCSLGSQCGAQECCVSDIRPIGKRMTSLGGHCKVMGTRGSSKYVLPQRPARV